MSKIDFKFNKFLNNSLKFVFIFVIIGVFYKGVKDINESKFGVFSIGFLVFMILFGIVLNYLMEKKYNKKILIFSICLIGLIIRLIWFYSVDSIPTSDFNRMYICAEEFLKGARYMFKGAGYMARFPHMSITVLYFSVIQKIFYTNPLVAIKFLNIIFSMINIVILYFISKLIFKNEKSTIWTLFLSAIYPPMIIYNNAYASENMAMPLFLLSVYLFLKSINKEKKLCLLIFSSLSLSIAHLFRPIAYVVIVAYILYILIYFKSGAKSKLILSSGVVVSFIVPTIIISYSLIHLNILERPLWKPTEPVSISILKGSNLSSYGHWNEEDAKVFGDCGEDYKKADEKAKEIIIDRFNNYKIKDIIELYVVKYTLQWRTGEFGGVGWVEDGLSNERNRNKYLKILGKEDGKQLIKLSKDGLIAEQAIYIIIVLLSYMALYTKDRNYKLDLIYILFCGFSLQCLITEAQDRYTYIISWIFIFLSINFFEVEHEVVIKKIKALNKKLFLKKCLNRRDVKDR